MQLHQHSTIASLFAKTLVWRTIVARNLSCSGFQHLQENQDSPVLGRHDFRAESRLDSQMQQSILQFAKTPSRMKMCTASQSARAVDAVSKQEIIGNEQHICSSVVLI